MPFTLQDLISVSEIVLVLVVSGFALLLPIYAYFKNLNTSLKVCIPLSISAEVMIGYLFYTAGQMEVFALSYLTLILAINIFFAVRLRLFQKIKKISFKFNWKVAIPVLLVVASALFARFYDAVLNIAPGALDAAAHAQYVLDIGFYGRLSCTYYAPGFHILIFPLSQFLEMGGVYRFAGPVLGSMTMLTIYLLFRDFFKNKLSNYFLVLAFGLPVFSILTLQTISFFPTSLSFIYVPMLVYLLTKPKELTAKMALLFFAITIFALALTVPYLLVQFIPAVIILYIIALFWTKKIGREYVGFLSRVSAIILLGFVLAFGHVYLQSAISNTNNTRSFPQIMIAEDQTSEISISTNLEKTYAFIENNSWLKKVGGESEVFQRYLMPMVMTGQDVISIKNLRPLDSAVSIVAYLWIVISLIMIYFGIRKKDTILLVLGSMILVFGVATQAGVFEMSTYRGRSGWYLLLFVLISSVYFLDLVIKKIPKILVYALILVFAAIPFISPPEFYRPYFIEYFTQAREISRRFPNQNILIITDRWRIITVSKNFQYAPLEPRSIEEGCIYDECFIIFANKFFEVDPVLSQKIIDPSKDLTSFIADQAELKKSGEAAVNAMKNSDRFVGYEKYFENENISIYRFIK